MKEFTATLDGQAGVVYSLSDRIGIEVYARSGGLPISINTAGVGLVLFTGAHKPLLRVDTLTAFRQLGRGGLVLSTSFSTNRTSQTATDPLGNGVNAVFSETTASLGFGYFVRDRTQIGLTGSYSVISSGGSFTAFSVAPYVKRYLNKGALTPYVSGSLAWQFRTREGDATPAYMGYLRAGLAYLPGKRFIIEAELIGIEGGYSATTPSANTGLAEYTPSEWHTSVYATLRPNLLVSYVFR